MNEELKPCPFCGGLAKITICDGEGNLRPDEYENDPWSGLGFQITHGDEDAIGECPIAKYSSDGGVMGIWIYDSREEATEAWNRRTAG